MSAVLLLLICGMQGLVVFATARAIWRKAGLRNGWLKPPLIAGSWLAWCTATAAAYFAAGGEGGLMDGFGLLLVLFATALAGSLAFLLGWLLAPLRRG